MISNYPKKQTSTLTWFLLSGHAIICTDSGTNSSGALIGGAVAAAIAAIILVLTMIILIILVWKTWSKQKASVVVKSKKDDPYYSYIPRTARTVSVDGVTFVAYESILSLDRRGVLPDSVATAAPAAVNQCVRCSAVIDEEQEPIGDSEDDPEISAITMIRNKAYKGTTRSSVDAGTSIGETHDDAQDETADANNNYVTMIRNSAYGSFDDVASQDTGIETESENSSAEASTSVETDEAGNDTDVKMVRNAAYRVNISIDAPAHAGIFVQSESLNEDEQKEQQTAGIKEREDTPSSS